MGNRMSNSYFLTLLIYPFLYPNFHFIYEITFSNIKFCNALVITLANLFML